MVSKDLKAFDYVIAGGGQAGCVLASRLSQKFPDCSIVLIEAGRNGHKDPKVQSALRSPELHGTGYQWNDMTVPQPGANNRPIYHGGGKLLSGGTGVNYGTWVRGHEVCYDEWARAAGDDRWAYKNLLPYFKKIETHYKPRDKCDNPEEHGFEGPVRLLEAPTYPLRSTLLNAITEAGHKEIADINSGQPLGVARWCYAWRETSGEYVRQPAGEVYDLSKVEVLLETRVRRIIIETDPSTNTPKAVGAELDNGETISASREVILSCGALRSPQLLFLSGLGPASDLSSHRIRAILDLPDIGANLHDHCSAMLFWKLKHPEKGLAIGSPKFDPQGIAPGEWVLTGSVSPSILGQALKKDGVNNENHPHTETPRAHYETIFGYYPAGAEPGVLPTDGSILTVGVANWLPTSRGSITLKSSDVCDAPIIDPQYLTTEHDLCVIREAIRDAMRIMETKAAQTEVESQFQLAGSNITLESSDEELNERIRQTCITWFHPAGTVAMGKVVDSSCRVMGVDSLRVIDASVFPLPISAHYQVPVYALAEKMADVIAGEA